MTRTNSPWVSAKDAAAYLAVDLRTIYVLCRTQGLRHTRLTDTKNGVLRFRTEWLDKFLDDRAQVRGGSR